MLSPPLLLPPPDVTPPQLLPPTPTLGAHFTLALVPTQREIQALKKGERWEPWYGLFPEVPHVTSLADSI